jgi:hypothetical protein
MSGELTLTGHPRTGHQCLEKHSKRNLFSYSRGMLDFDILPSSEEADPWTARNVRQNYTRTNLVVVTFVYLGCLGFI